MEKTPNEEYRNDLADKLNEIRSSNPENSELAKARAQGYLEAKKEGGEYAAASEETVSQRRTKYIEDHELPAIEASIRSLFEGSKIMEERGVALDGQFRMLSEDEVGVGIEIDISKYIQAVGNKSKDSLLSAGHGAAVVQERRESDVVWKNHGPLIKKEPRDHDDAQLYRGFWDRVRSSLANELNARSAENQNLTPYKIRILQDGTENHVFFDEEDGGKWKTEIAEFFLPVGAFSSKRFKEEIETLEETVEKLGKLRGVSFKWISSGDSPREIGVIAEEVAEVFPELVFLDKAGKPLGVHYDKFVAVLIEAVKSLDKRVKELEK